MTGPGDEKTAAESRGHGGLRASRADREQAIDLLKAAFVAGRLTKDELAMRVGQVLASRTYTDLAALTADIPAAPARPKHARAHGRASGNHTARDVAIGLGLGLIIAAAIVLGGLLQYTLLLLPLALCSLPVVSILVVTRRLPRLSSDAPAGSYHRGQGRAARPPKSTSPAKPIIIQLYPQTAPIRRAPNCGLTAHGRVGRIPPGGAPGHRAAYGRHPTPCSTFALRHRSIQRTSFGNLAPSADATTAANKPKDGSWSSPNPAS
jgi:hypothetical protein